MSRSCCVCLPNSRPNESRIDPPEFDSRTSPSCGEWPQTTIDWRRRDGLSSSMEHAPPKWLARTRSPRSSVESRGEGQTGRAAIWDRTLAEQEGAGEEGCVIQVPAFKLDEESFSEHDLELLVPGPADHHPWMLASRAP